MTDEARTRTTLWARAFVDELARAGVRTICLAPGSRSTPLVLAAARDGRLQVRAHLDERSAAFFALGVGRATRRPAAVLTTSGTAAANVYPAVVEACQGEVPLLVLTADRPHRLRDTDANQAVDQLRLYGSFVRAFFEVSPPSPEDAALRHLRGLAARAVAAAVGVPPGPVHLNFPFAKPLEPPEEEAGGVPEGSGTRGREGGAPFVAVRPRRALPAAGTVREVAALLSGVGRGVIVAGPSPDPRTAEGVRALGAATGFPVLADPLSGARFGAAGGAWVVGGYDLFLRDAATASELRPEAVVRVGASPTSAALLAYLERHAGAAQIVVDAGWRWKDHTATAHHYFPVEPGPLLEGVAAEVRAGDVGEWVEAWRRAEEAAAGVVREELEGALFEGTVPAVVAADLPEGSALFVSSSMPVRDLDAFALPRDTEVRVFGNRGASGIDGIVSTALGVASEWRRPAAAVLGDVAFYHDMNGLLAARRWSPDLALVVIHNDGGGIFHMLPVRELEPAFTPYFAAPHGLDFRWAARLYGLPFHRVEGAAALSGALREAREAGGTHIVEVRSDREAARRRREETVERVRRALATR